MNLLFCLQRSSVKAQQSLFACTSSYQSVSFSSTLTTRKKNLYNILEVQPGATQEEIKDAFYRLSKKYHPDAKTASVESDGKMDSEKFLEIQEAYNILKSEGTRADYDEKVKKPMKRAFTLRMQKWAKWEKEEGEQKLKKDDVPSTNGDKLAKTAPSRFAAMSNSFKILSTQRPQFFNPTEQMNQLEKEEKISKIFVVCFLLFLIVYYFFLRFLASRRKEII